MTHTHTDHTHRAERRRVQEERERSPGERERYSLKSGEVQRRESTWPEGERRRLAGRGVPGLAPFLPCLFRQRQDFHQPGLPRHCPHVCSMPGQVIWHFPSFSPLLNMLSLPANHQPLPRPCLPPRLPEAANAQLPCHVTKSPCLPCLG